MLYKCALRLAAGVWLGLMLVASLPVMAQSPIEGTWLTALESEITITPCPEGFCGFISKIVVPDAVKAEHAEVQDMAVEQFLDANNKDPNLRARPILGLQILTLHPAQKPLVYDGEIYNPEDGNVYSGYMEVVDGETVRLNGCVLFNIICRGEDWKRVMVPEEDTNAVPESQPEPVPAN
jgi:uncharacterized protein (DUF2147 family)